MSIAKRVGVLGSNPTIGTLKCVLLRVFTSATTECCTVNICMNSIIVKNT